MELTGVDVQSLGPSGLDLLITLVQEMLAEMAECQRQRNVSWDEQHVSEATHNTMLAVTQTRILVLHRMLSKIGKVHGLDSTWECEFVAGTIQYRVSANGYTFKNLETK